MLFTLLCLVVRFLVSKNTFHTPVSSMKLRLKVCVLLSHLNRVSKTATGSKSFTPYNFNLPDFPVLPNRLGKKGKVMY
jgi:hypothetical protein